MGKAYLGAIDQGTTSTRFIVFNEKGEIVSSDQMEHEQIMLKEGWVEHDPVEIWNATKATSEAALKKAKLKASDLAGVGITNQRETTVGTSSCVMYRYKPSHVVIWLDISL